MIDYHHPELSIKDQCEALGIPRSSFYYEPAQESDLNLLLMRRIDEIHLKLPFYGYRKMTVELKEMGFEVNAKRVRRLMEKMRIIALYPKPKLSISTQREKKYPYLLRGISIEHVNQVWSTDITYIPLSGGFLYLVAIMDWFSRCVLSWELSNTLEAYSGLKDYFMFYNERRPHQSLEYKTPLKVYHEGIIKRDGQIKNQEIN